MIEINRRHLSGSWLKCFNPSLVYYQGRYLLFYRYTPQPNSIYTSIAFVELALNFQPLGQQQQVQLPRMTDRVMTMDDPRAFVWRDELWLLHVQAARYRHRHQWHWSTAIVLARVELTGQVSQVYVPAYGRNINYAVADAPPAFEKNWTPLVIEDDLYIVYEINPLTILKFQPKQEILIPVCYQPWINPYPTYLSGGTPLISWLDSEYVGLFHTYTIRPDQERLYSMGFYTLDVEQWCITRISQKPVLTAWEDDSKDLRRWEQFGQGKALVVFPGGIVDYGETWAVSFGWNDCRCYIQLFDKNQVASAIADK